jgi:hypothetical protein
MEMEMVKTERATSSLEKRRDGESVLEEGPK